MRISLLKTYGALTQLKATKVNTLEYKTIVKEIGVLSMEYQKLVDAPKKPKMSHYREIRK